MIEIRYNKFNLIINLFVLDFKEWKSLKPNFCASVYYFRITTTSHSLLLKNSTILNNSF